MDRESHFRRASKTIQPVTQAHDWMFPYHARPGVTHYRLDLLTAVTLIAMDGTLRARWLFGAESAALQPHSCVIQQPLTFRAQRQARLMMVAAMDFYHRLHCLPFPGEPWAGKSNGFGFRCDVGENIRCVLFGRYIHAIIVAHQSPRAFDPGQSFAQFMVRKKSGTC